MRAGLFFAAGADDGAEDLALGAIAVSLQEFDVAVDEDALTLLESVVEMISLLFLKVASGVDGISYLLQFKGSAKVPGLSQTKGLHALPDFLPTFDPVLGPPLVCKSESWQGSAHAQGCTQAIWLGQ